ncbi:MAG: GAF domain-containing protein [Acidimicrobiales bacterium]|nr:GAF domain-containing protein [Acidimicrobiales bacterium]
MTARTLSTLVATAQTAVGAEFALLYTPTADDRLEIVASAGRLVAPATTAVEPEETYAGMVLGSQQPVAMQVRAGDQRVRAETALIGHGPSALCYVPCVGDAEVRGVLALLDKAGGGGFDFDDVEIATMLAEVAGTALEERDDSTESPSPETLGRMLENLATNDPGRYAQVATLVEMVLASG